MDKVTSWEWSQQFFPLSIIIGDDGKIIRASSRLIDKFEENIVGECLQDVFNIVRPKVVGSCIDLKTMKNSVFLMTALNGNIAVRAQLCQGEDENQVFLMGSPWLSWMKQNAPEKQLFSDDFPVHDSQMEHEFFMSSQQQMLSDLEELTDSLKEAKDRAQEADKAKSEFVSHISHEMRTPLNGVVSAVNLLSKEELPEESMRLVSIARASSEALMDVINEVLDFSRIGSGSMSFENVDFKPARLVNDAVLMLSSRAKDKGINLQNSAAEEILPVVVGDAEKIRQVLVNLIGNAIKYSDDGEVSVKAVSKKFGEEAASIRFEVSDQGRGISEEDQKRVFEPFWCKGAGLGVNESSTGLGLSICSQIIDKMDGSLGLSSELGKGSTFWFELQLPMGEEQGEEQEHDLPAINSANADEVSFTGKVLLVDDNPVNLTLGKLLIERHGLEVSCAADGAEAVEKAVSGDYDLVFMDIKMPVMDGVEATEKLREQYDAQQLPICALTANVSEVDKQRYLGAGMNSCLTKPIIEEDLIRVLSEWVSVQKDSSDMDNEVQSKEERTADQTASSDPILDKAVLDKLRSDVGDDNLSFVADQLFGEAEKRMKSLFEAQNDESIDIIGREAHTLGSSMLGFGALRFGNRLRKIEAAANDENLDSLTDLLGDVEQDYQQAVQELQQYMAAK